MQLHILELNIITTKLKPQQMNLIIHSGVKRATGISPVLSFPGGKGANEWLIENGYIDTRELMYVPVSAFIEKVHAKMINTIKNYPHKEIRFVLHCGVPEAKDTEGYWIGLVAKFGKNFRLDMSVMFQMPDLVAPKSLKATIKSMVAFHKSDH